jgi:hypothetical protein
MRVSREASDKAKSKRQKAKLFKIGFIKKASEIFDLQRLFAKC